MATTQTSLEAIARSLEFESASPHIRSALNSAALGIPITLAANAQWLKEKFGDADQARMVFGQKLSPLAPTPAPVQLRTALVDQVISNTAGPPIGKVTAVLGGEGVGKS